MNNNPNDLLHGLTLQTIVNKLVEFYGWDELGQKVNINCFNSDPSVKSSLKFLRKEYWARLKVEKLYIKTFLAEKALELKEQEKEVEIARKIIQNSEIRCIYFVYPKNKNFDKHIELKITSLENISSKYIVKVIPYSLNDLYKKGMNNGNCNILCK